MDNWVINVCPIMVQRDNRVRLLRLIAAELRQRGVLPLHAMGRLVGETITEL
jgi:hypothetical protein